MESKNKAGDSLRALLVVNAETTSFQFSVAMQFRELKKLLDPIEYRVQDC